MAEDMDVDMSFSDVMDVDVSMADADISRLLNGTHVTSTRTLATPVKPYVRAHSDLYISGDVLPAKTTQKQLNSTFNLDEVDNVNEDQHQTNGNNTPRALNVTVDVKNDLNATYPAVSASDERNGNTQRNNLSTNFNATFEVSNDNSASNMSKLSDMSNVSKSSDNSPTNVTVIDLQDQDRTVEANASSRSLLNLTREEGGVNMDGNADVTRALAPNGLDVDGLMGCTAGKEKICKLLNLTADVEPRQETEEQADDDDQEVFVDAQAPEEEIRQMLEGRRASLTRHSEEITLADQLPDMFDEQELRETYALDVEGLSGHSSGHSSGNYHDVEQQPLDKTMDLGEIQNGGEILPLDKTMVLCQIQNGGEILPLDKTMHLGEIRNGGESLTANKTMDLSEIQNGGEILPLDKTMDLGEIQNGGEILPLDKTMGLGEIRNGGEILPLDKTMDLGEIRNGGESLTANKTMDLSEIQNGGESLPLDKTMDLGGIRNGGESITLNKTMDLGEIQNGSESLPLNKTMVLSEIRNGGQSLPLDKTMVLCEIQNGGEILPLDKTMDLGEIRNGGESLPANKTMDLGEIQNGGEILPLDKTMVLGEIRNGGESITLNKTLDLGEIQNGGEILPLDLVKTPQDDANLTVSHLGVLTSEVREADSPVKPIESEETVKTEEEQIKAVIEFTSTENDVKQPEFEVIQPQIEVIQPQIDVMQPQINIAQPPSEDKQPEIEIIQPQIVVVQPQMNVVQPPIEVKQPQIGNNLVENGFTPALAVEQMETEENLEETIYFDSTLTEIDSIPQDIPSCTISKPANHGKRNSTSLRRSILTTCHEDTLRNSPVTKNGLMDDSIQLMLDQSVMSPLENQFNSTMMAVAMPTKRKHLLDSTLDSDAATPTSLQQQQELLLAQQKVMLEAVNRKNTEKVPVGLMNKDDGMLLDQTIVSATENKENIAAVGHRPRVSLLLQFDTLSSLNGSINKEPTQQSPLKALSPAAKPEATPISVGRLVDVGEDVEYKRIMDAANEEKMNLMQEVNRLKLEMNQVRQDKKEEKMSLVQEVNRLKLEMNQVQQENTTLTLEIQKKEEVYLKAEANTQLQVDQYKQEIKQLLDQLESAKATNNNEELLTDLKLELKQRELEIKKCLEENAHYKKIMNEYESTLSVKNCENEKLKNEHATVTQHLAALEVSFSDTITKYDRCKDIIGGFSRNEDTLKERLEKSNQIAIKYEERYETLKSHANAQLDKANIDLVMAKDSHKAEHAKLNTLIKRMEINNASLQHSLEQKVAECTALAQLCDEMTGSAPLH